MKKQTIISTTTTTQFGTINLPSGVKLVANPTKMTAGEITTQFLIEVHKNIMDIPVLINKVAIIDYLNENIFKSKSIRVCRSSFAPFIEVNGEFSVDWEMKSFGVEGYNLWRIFQHKKELISLKSREQALAVINDIFPK